jgi:Ser/Thr protein kinase RdoA (MazF antagonist)
MLSPAVLNQAKALWEIDDELEFVRRVANYIYYSPKHKIYFRLTESWHRSLSQIESELDWMFYLESKQIEFAHPIKSFNQKYCEVVELEMKNI